MHPNKGIKKLGILVAGGPAPGINGVIRSVTIEAINSGLEVIGIYDGFKWLIEGRGDAVRPLKIEDVTRIHYRGGSILRTSRSNPLKDEKTLQQVVKTLKDLQIDALVTIGGEGTAFCAYRLNKTASEVLKVVHVPKTIDNDIYLPGFMPTFGFHTARHYGTEIVQALMEDAKTTSRWYFVVSMGRNAGHLALGIGKASGATITVIGEEFRGKKIQFSDIADILEGAIIKRLAMNRSYGVALLAEGLSDCIDDEELKKYAKAERDAYGQLPFEDIELGRLLRNEVTGRLKRRKMSTSIVSKNIGYELRCMPPIPFDLEYTQDLGYAAIRFLLDGETGAIVSIKRGGKIDPLPFEDLLDPSTNRMRVRKVDIHSDSYQVALKYMIRLEGKDFEDPDWLRQLGVAGNMEPAEFKKRFQAVAGFENKLK